MEVHMSKSDRNNGKKWSPEEVKELKRLAKENTPTRVIGLKLGRTEAALRSKASQEAISLKPTNQRPYGSAEENCFRVRPNSNCVIKVWLLKSLPTFLTALPYKDEYFRFTKAL
jgi:hypothetical protein